jgi:hypothetical protein
MELLFIDLLLFSVRNLTDITFTTAPLEIFSLDCLSVFGGIRNVPGTSPAIL